MTIRYHHRQLPYPVQRFSSAARGVRQELFKRSKIMHKRWTKLVKTKQDTLDIIVTEWTLRIPPDLKAQTRMRERNPTLPAGAGRLLDEYHLNQLKSDEAGRSPVRPGLQEDLTTTNPGSRGSSIRRMYPQLIKKLSLKSGKVRTQTNDYIMYRMF